MALYKPQGTEIDITPQKMKCSTDDLDKDAGTKSCCHHCCKHQNCGIKIASLAVAVIIVVFANGFYMYADSRDSQQVNEQMTILMRRLEQLDNSVTLQRDELLPSGASSPVLSTDLSNEQNQTLAENKEQSVIMKRSTGQPNNVNGNHNGNQNFINENGGENGNSNHHGEINGNHNGNGNNGNGIGNQNGNGNGIGNRNGNIAEFARGSTFIRWGRFSCPQTSSLLYSGFAAAAYPMKGYGGSTDMECLPNSPTWHRNSASSPAGRTLLAAVKFSLSGHRGVLSPRMDGSAVVCAVCFTKRAPTLVMPGRTGCPNGFIREYYGNLMSTPAKAGEYYYSSKNYCVDSSPAYQGGHARGAGQQLTFVQAGDCNNNQYPCSSYRKGSKIACTVCTKDDRYY